MRKSLTLVIAAYNAARYLEFIFTALRRQSFQDFEVIVADDGSGPEVAKLIEATVPRVSFPIKHLWQPDEGFRKNVILNKSIESSQTDYLVFIDGDCLPHHEFIRDHAKHRQPNGVLCGYRVNLSKQITEKLRLEDIASGGYEKFRPGLLFDGLMARSSTLEEGIRIENPFLRRLLGHSRVRILGSNFSLEKEILEKINGFNEDYRAPGLGEDSEVAHRLDLIGARFISLRYLAILYHLYHPPTKIGEENKQLYELALSSTDPVCRNGLRKLT